MQSIFLFAVCYVDSDVGCVELSTACTRKTSGVSCMSPLYVYITTTFSIAFLSFHLLPLLFLIFFRAFLLVF